MIKLYSTHCPQCNTLEIKLDRSGIVYEYVDQESYEAALKQDTNLENLEERQIYFYTEGSSRYEDESGQSFDIWLKTLVDANKKDGYECK